MGLLSRIIRPFKSKAEGESRPGPWWLPVSGGWLSSEAGSNLNWWQLGGDVQYYSPSAMVEACVSAYSQTVAMCPGDHWWTNEDGGRERVTTSSLSRVLRIPNAYQTFSDFLLNAIRYLYIDGNAYALALRNSRFEITELHLMNSQQCTAQIAVTGEVFYSLGGNEVVDRLLPNFPLIVPARDVLHLRLNTSRSMLLGESPLRAAARDIAVMDAAAAQQLQFYLNQARPSTVLATDMVLDKDQVEALRERWNQQSRGLAAGGTPILTAGLKPVAVPTINPVDAQLAELMKMSEQHIALAFRTPLQILGIGTGGVGSTEALMQGWLSSGLGFCLNHVETALDKLFDLKGVPNEYTELDTSVLLRSAFKERVDSYVRGVQGGIFEPNFARAEFDLPAVKYGDEPRVQQQVVPLSAAAGIPSAPGPGAAPPAEAQPIVPEQGIAADVNKQLILGRFRSRLAHERNIPSAS